MDRLDVGETFLSMLESNDTSLVDLNLSHAHPPPTLMASIAAALKSNTHLSCLNLSGNALEDHDIAGLFDALRYNTGLVKLDLSENASIGDAAVRSLLSVVTHENATVRHVNLSGTAVSMQLVNDLVFVTSLNTFPRQLKPAVMRARSNDGGFFELELVYDPSDPKVYNEKSTRVIVDSLRTNTTVTSLKLDRCCRSEHCLSMLSELFCFTQFIRRVSLRNNMLGDESSRLLVDAMKKNEELVLEELDLGRNEIGDVGCGYLADFLQHNHVLRAVILDHNPASLVALERVRSGCALNCEPSTLKPLLPRLLENDPDVQVLSLEGSESTRRGPSKGYFTNLGASTVAAALAHNSVVHTINFSSNHIGPEGARALGDLLKRNESLTSIDLSNNPLFDEGVRYLIMGLQQNDNIVHCDVSNTSSSAHGIEEVRAICHVNQQPLPLKECLMSKQLAGSLQLNRQLKQPRGKLGELSSDSLPLVVKVLQQNPSVTELDLTDNRIGDKGVAFLAEFLKRPRCTLKKLVLCNVGITDAAVEALIAAVKCNYTLRVIHTTGNLNCTFKPQSRLNDAVSLNQYVPAVKDIVPLLQANVKGIRTVDFSRKSNEGTPLGDDTARMLFHALRENNGVTSVSLANQGLSNRGVGYACDCLAANNVIQRLDLSLNTIGPDGAATLADLLEINASLTSLNLMGNKILESGGVALLQAFRMSNRTLTHINVDECGVSEATANNIHALVAFNGEAIEFRRQILERIGGLSEVSFTGDVTSGYLGDSSCRALYFAMITHAHHVCAIKLDGNRITLAGLKWVGKAIEAAPSVAHVSLRRNNIEGAESFAESLLLKHLQLRTFDLSENNLCERSLARQQLLLRLNGEPQRFRTFFFNHESQRGDCPPRPLKTLELPRLGLKSSSVALLVELLGSDESLSAISLIDLSNNEIGDEGVVCLLNELSRLGDKMALRALYLDHNKIGERGITAIAEFVWHSSQIIIVSFSGNPAIASEALSVAATAATEGISMKIAENRRAVDGCEQQLSTLHRNVAAVAGSGVAAARVVHRRIGCNSEHEFPRFSETDILSEALQGMPKREPVVRRLRNR